MVTIDELCTETLRLRKLRHIVDISSNLIVQGSMSRVDAERLVRFMRGRILALFPAERKPAKSFMRIGLGAS